MRRRAWNYAGHAERGQAANRQKWTGQVRDRIDPATADRQYTPDELEFLRASDQYAKEHDRRFLCASDYLRILLELGYTKQQHDGELVQPLLPDADRRR